MNRAERRTARRARIPRDVLDAAQAAGSCPDCGSSAALGESPPGVFRLVVAHDPTCPWLRAQEGRGR